MRKSEVNVKGMVKNKYIAQGISDAGWNRFFNFLSYKCDWYGRNLIQIGQFDASSKICNVCGHKNDELTLSDFIEMLVYEDCWNYYNDIFKIDQNLLRNMFDEVRKARNQLAHFRGELSSDQRDNLKFCKVTNKKKVFSIVYDLIE